MVTVACGKPMSMANCRLPAGVRFADGDGGEPAAAVNVKKLRNSNDRSW
jgi:hypothetical protein